MKKLAVLGPCIVGLALAAIAIGLHQRGKRIAAFRAERTATYIASLDLDTIQRRGSDFLNPRYDPNRLGIPLEEIDPHTVYDFQQLAEAERKLEGVDRRVVLEYLFDEVTRDAETNIERHLALLKFLHRASYHSVLLRPLHPSGDKVHDPLIVLELNEMHCTHAARMAIDLWEAGGYRARGINFGAKTSAEVFYDDAWHYFGADSIGGNGISLFKPDGTIPSWVELSETPQWIDSLPYRYELKRNGAPRLKGTPSRSTNCFYNTKGWEPMYFGKSGPASPDDYLYGWYEHHTTWESDWVVDEDGDAHHQPGAVAFREVRVERAPGSDRASVSIRWKPGFDHDGDILGYRVFVGTHPRGWNYAKFTGSDESERFWSSRAGWSPEMYDALYTLPPHDAALVETAEPEVRLELDPRRTHFVTVMAFDEYHERIGKQLYLQSNELRIDPAASNATDEVKTDAYIAALDLAEIDRRGRDLLSPRYYDPARFGKPIKAVRKGEYDFARLSEVEQQLAGIDRRRVLAHMFGELTADAQTDTERHLAILRFLHRASAHCVTTQPFHPDGARVLDPLILLELNEMFCGQVARVACDLFDAAGYPTRGVSLDGHTIAEIYYDDGWHFFDADSAGGNGLTVMLPDGSIPSLAELGRQPHLLDALPYRFEPKPGHSPRVAGSPVRSHRYFSEGEKPGRGYFVKNQPPDPVSRAYGWDDKTDHPPDWESVIRPERFQPGAVGFTGAATVTGAIELQWKPARDRDDDLLGYRVFVSAQPRGWSFDAFAGPPDMKRLWNGGGGWTPDMYDALFRLPPHEIALIETREPHVRIDLTHDGPVYVTVMPFDAYHERAGKTLYLMSNELRLTRATTTEEPLTAGG